MCTFGDEKQATGKKDQVPPLKTMARAVALPTAAASVRIFFIRASGAKGCPFSIPIAPEHHQGLKTVGTSGPHAKKHV
jgi:hypothetical protein